MSHQRTVPHSSFLTLESYHRQPLEKLERLPLKTVPRLIYAKTIPVLFMNEEFMNEEQASGE